MIAEEGCSRADRRAYLVDDDDTFRNSLAALLSSAGWRADSFSSVPNFLEMCAALPPGVVLLDVRMPGMNGIDLLESGNPKLANFAIVMITGHGDVGTAVRALKLGALDFLEKPFSGSDLLAMLDQSYESLLERAEKTKRRSLAEKSVRVLSARELDVLRGLIAGGSHKQIARHFGISDRTVEMYRNNMVRKLGVRNTTEAVNLGVLANVEAADLSV